MKNLRFPLIAVMALALAATGLQAHAAAHAAKVSLGAKGVRIRGPPGEIEGSTRETGGVR